MIKSYFVGEKIVSTSEEAFTLFEKSRFGEKKDKRIEYAGVEAIFLIEQNRMELVSGKKILGAEELLKKAKKKDKKN